MRGKYNVKRHAVEQPLDPSYRIIPLTQNKNALVSTHRYDELALWTWCVYKCKANNSYYAVRGGKKGETKTVPMHIHIMGRLGCEIDHINGDSLDNRDENLRPATESQNLANRGKQRNNTSGYKGVARNNKTDWMASIQFHGKHLFIGNFKDKIPAARAYDRKAIELFGEFAYTNFPVADYD
jgi:hypothetical protein